MDMSVADDQIIESFVEWFVRFVTQLASNGLTNQEMAVIVFLPLAFMFGYYLMEYSKIVIKKMKQKAE